MVAPLTMFLYAPQKLLVTGAREGGRDVEDALTTEFQRDPFGKGALAAPGTAKDQSAYSYDASPSTLRSVPTSRPFSSAPRTATRKKPDPSPRKGSQPRTSMPFRARSSGNVCGPRASKKFAEPG